MNDETRETDEAIQTRCLEVMRNTLLQGSPALEVTRLPDTITSLSRLVSRMSAERSTLPALSRQWCPAVSKLRERLEALGNSSHESGGQVRSAIRDYASLRQNTERIATVLNDRANQGILKDLARAGSPAASWFRDAVDAASQITTTIESAVTPLQSSSPQSIRDAEETRSRLNEYFRRSVPDWGTTPVSRLVWVPGGRSKWTAWLDMADGAPKPHLILRMDAPGINYTGTKAAEEYALLRSLYDAGAKVALPVLAETDSSIIGGTFLISEAIVGAHKGGEPFPELIPFKSLSPDFGRQLATTLARQHRMALPGGSGHLGTLHGSQIRDRIDQFAQIWSAIPNKPPLHLATDLGFAWLLSREWPSNRPVALVHGDLGMHNILIKDGNLAALLDWELMHLGDPAEDIGNCRATLIESFIGWKEFVKHYIAAGGDPAACDLETAIAQSVWAHVRGSFYVAQMWNLVMTGAQPDLEYAAIGWDFFCRTQDYALRELSVAVNRPTISIQSGEES